MKASCLTTNVSRKSRILGRPNVNSKIPLDSQFMASREIEDPLRLRTFVRLYASSSRRSHSRISKPVLGLILAFRDSGQSPSDFWRNGIARNDHYLGRHLAAALTYIRALKINSNHSIPTGDCRGRKLDSAARWLLCSDRIRCYSAVFERLANKLDDDIRDRDPFIALGLRFRDAGRAIQGSRG